LLLRIISHKENPGKDKEENGKARPQPNEVSSQPALRQGLYIGRITAIVPH
jgi:hypothetical protein